MTGFACSIERSSFLGLGQGTSGDIFLLQRQSLDHQACPGLWSVALSLLSGQNPPTTVLLLNRTLTHLANWNPTRSPPDLAFGLLLAKGE